MSAMYAVYHGPQGLKDIANRCALIRGKKKTFYNKVFGERLETAFSFRVHVSTAVLAAGVRQAGYKLRHEHFFDTLKITPKDDVDALEKRAKQLKINLRYFDDGDVGVSLDEATQLQDLDDLLQVFGSPNTAVSHDSRDFLK